MRTSAMKGSKRQPSWGPHGALRTTGIGVTGRILYHPHFTELETEAQFNYLPAIQASRTHLSSPRRAGCVWGCHPSPGGPVGQPLAYVLCSLPESGPHPGGGRGRAWAAAVEGGGAPCSPPPSVECLHLFLCIHPGVYVIALLYGFNLLFPDNQWD